MSGPGGGGGRGTAPQWSAGAYVRAAYPPHYYRAPPYPPAPTTDRRQRRRKRTQSPPAQAAAAQPPPQPQPYYMPYPPQMYPPQFHVPVYQPVYYPYPPYMEYPVAPEEPDRSDEYPTDGSEHEVAPPEYYAPAYPPPYDPSFDYGPPQYVHAMAPPPPHIYHPPPPPPAHQFNVHAKNFVHNPSRLPQSQPEVTEVPEVRAITDPIDTLNIKELTLNEEPPVASAEGHIEELPTTPVASAADFNDIVEQPKTSPEKVQPETSIKPSFPQQISRSVPTASVNSKPHIPNKSGKGPAPFSSAKPIAKTTAPGSTPTAPPSKPPFSGRPRRDGPRTDDEEEHPKRESKATAPITVTLSTNPPMLVGNKGAFGRQRHNEAPVDPKIAPPPPVVPTASDFPPPPTPRRRNDTGPTLTPSPTPAPPAQPAGKSWASLFASKQQAEAASPGTTQHTSGSSSTTSQMTQHDESVNTMVVPSKPVAKVPPFDSSPLQQTSVATNTAGMASPTSTTTVSYSEKTSANTTSVVGTAKQQENSKDRVPSPKDNITFAPVQASPLTEDPNSYRMGEFLSKYQLDHRSISLLPRGLSNRSNFCYVNSILQALIACPPFYNMLKALPYQTRRGKSSTPVIDAMVELCYEFPASTMSANNGRGGNRVSREMVTVGLALDAAAGLKVLRAVKHLPPGHEHRQEDAEEFLSTLLNSLNDEMLELMKLVEPSDGSKEPVQPLVETREVIEGEDDDEWKVMASKKKACSLDGGEGGAARTPLTDIFRGRTRARTHRAHPHTVSDSLQPFFTLPLDIERTSSVQSALELLGEESGSADDTWQQIWLERLPPILCIHLKCFQLTHGNTAKILKPIDYPLDLKVDSKILSSKTKYTSKQRLYKLFAVVYHEGMEAGKGHYVTDTYHGQAGWTRYDDSTVTFISDSAVLKPRPPRMPYLLMYRRHDTLAPPRKMD